MFIEKKYISFISNRIQKFKWKSPNLANARCPLCGDSKTNPNKTRFYIYEKEHKWFVFCHKCGYSSTFAKFLKLIDPRLYAEYTVEKLGDYNEKPEAEIKWTYDIKFDDKTAWEALKKAKKISQLPLYHPAKKYVDSRKIPPVFHAIMRYIPNFMEWTNERIPGKFKENALKHDEGRILIPFFNSHNHFFAYTGRSLAVQAEVRYISIVLNPSELFLWGQERVDLKKPVLVTEGPIDAMFLTNCIAVAGSNISSLTKLAERDTFTLVMDNEPHSKEAKGKIMGAIDQGYKVALFPSNIIPKDINAMVLAGYSPGYIEHIIKENTFEGIEAKMRLEQWSKR